LEEGITVDLCAKSAVKSGIKRERDLKRTGPGNQLKKRVFSGITVGLGKKMKAQFERKGDGEQDRKRRDGIDSSLKKIAGT